MPQCKEITKGGERCKSNALMGSEYCFGHDPATAEKAFAARLLGGKNRAVGHAGDMDQVCRAPRTIEEAYSILDYALEETLAQDNSAARTKNLIALFEAYSGKVKSAELEKDLQELREQITSLSERA